MKEINGTGTHMPQNNGLKGIGTISTDLKTANILDSTISRLKEEVDIYLSNLNYLKELSHKYPILTNVNSGISQFSSEYGIPELDRFERRFGKDFQTSFGEDLVGLEQTIIALEERGVDVSTERQQLTKYKTIYRCANYDYTSDVPEYGTISKRRSIAKTIFGMRELGLETRHDDRLMEWDYDKYESERKRSGIHGFPRTFKQIQDFLSNYHGRPVELKWVQSIDPGNGHNLLLYGFHFKK